MKSGEGITASSITQHDPYPCYGGNGLRGYTSSFTHEGDFALIGRQGALCGNVNSASGKFFASEHAVVVTPRSGTDIHFLTYLLRELRLNRLSEASAQPGLSVSKILQLSVPLPSNISEQRAIAQALGDVDALITALDRLITKKRDIKQATIQQLLTGKTRLPGFSGKWEMKQLKDCAKFCSGSYLSQEEYIDGPFEIQGAGNTMGMHITANFHEPLTVIGRVGTVGRPRFMPSGCWVNNNAGAIVANTTIATPFFVHLILCTMDWRKATSVTAQPFLVIDSLMKMEVMLPDISEQVAISTVLADIDAELTALEARRDKTRALKQGMMQELLTGKTRLI